MRKLLKERKRILRKKGWNLGWNKFGYQKLKKNTEKVGED